MTPNPTGGEPRRRLHTLAAAAPAPLTVSAADFASQSVSSDSAGFNGGSATTTLTACVTYGFSPPALTLESPMTILLPLSAAAIGVAGLFRRAAPPSPRTERKLTQLRRSADGRGSGRPGSATGRYEDQIVPW